MVNKKFQYPHYDLWFNDKWEDRQSALLPLAVWIGENAGVHSSESTRYPLFPEGTDVRKLPLYRAKTQSIDDPEMMSFWEEKGLSCNVLEMGRAHWVSCVPGAASKEKQDKLPVLTVFHKENLKDPYWAMRTLEYYEQYNEAAIRENFIIFYLVSDRPDTEGMYGNQLQEGLVLYPCDENRVLLDVSLFREGDKSLKDVPGYNYTDPEGNPADPDKAVQSFSSLGIPVLDITKRWENRDSMTRNLFMNYPMNKDEFDVERVLHSEAGAKMAEALALEYDYSTILEPDFAGYWAKMGLRFEIHKTRGERWTTVTPECSFDHPGEKLPVVVILQEVNYSNEHLAVNAMSYLYEYQKIAANGDAILLYFVLEDPESNEILCDILDEAFEKYPIDKSRVYLTGHSHDGFFSMIFARRHPEIVAAVATLGNPNGLMDPAISGETVFSSSDETIDLLSTMDLPVINILGVHEGGPFNKEVHISSWQRRLKASRCPMKSAEEIEAALESDDKATRMLGVPSDRSETFYAEGFEHYIADIKNSDGKFHLRIVRIEGMPHVTTPFMQTLSWSFMRKFSRDQKTGKIVELL